MRNNLTVADVVATASSTGVVVLQFLDGIALENRCHMPLLAGIGYIMPQKELLALLLSYTDISDCFMGHMENPAKGAIYDRHNYLKSCR